MPSRRSGARGRAWVGVMGAGWCDGCGVVRERVGVGGVWVGVRGVGWCDECWVCVVNSV